MTNFIASNLRNSAFWGLCALGIVASVGCGSEKEIDKIGDAQICLNSVKASEVSTCTDKLAGLESAAAYSIRCNAAFIREGFADPIKYIDAFEELENSSNGTVSFMGLVTFASQGEVDSDTNNSEVAFGDCLRGGGRGTTLISAFSFMAMGMYQYLEENKSSPKGACSSTPSSTGYNLEGCLAAYSSLADAQALVNMANPTADSSATFQTGLGSALIAAHDVSCIDTKANEDLCSTLSTTISSVGTSSPRRVASKFLCLIIVETLTEPARSLLQTQCDSL